MKLINIEENVKNRIIDLITEGSEDRLISFKPSKEKSVADLIVKKRGGYNPPIFSKRLGSPIKTKKVFSDTSKFGGRELSFQINIFIGPEKNKNIAKDILQESFIPGKDFYLMFVYFDEVKQSISNIWIIPSLIFSELAELKKIENNKAILRFESALNLETKDKYARFLIKQKELGNFLLETINAKNGVNFLRNNFLYDEAINLDKLKKFIIESRENTYAADSKQIENPRISGSVQLEYQKADYFYQDIYFAGSKIFIGQETVYFNNRPVWAMNYLGDIAKQEILSFLKLSLLKLSQECRFGKKCQFEKRELEYQDNGQGELDLFSGKESIYQKNKNIYNLTYQGGLLLE